MLGNRARPGPIKLAQFRVTTYIKVADTCFEGDNGSYRHGEGVVILNYSQPKINDDSEIEDWATPGGCKGRIDEVEVAEELLEDTSVPACFVLSS